MHYFPSAGKVPLLLLWLEETDIHIGYGLWGMRVVDLQKLEAWNWFIETVESKCSWKWRKDQVEQLYFPLELLGGPALMHLVELASGSTVFIIAGLVKRPKISNIHIGKYA